MVVLPSLEQVSPTSSYLDVIDKATKILALVVGGCWAYLNYVRGRTFKKRLELRISGKSLRHNDISLLCGSAQMKNVGLSKFPIEQKGTAILVFDLMPSVIMDRVAEPRQGQVEVLEVFKSHAWIEPGETIEEFFMVQLPPNNDRLAIELDLRVVAAHFEWNANCVVELPSMDQSPK